MALPRMFRGAALHRWALAAAHSQEPALAERLFECAAGRYREELSVEALARLRVHQEIARLRAHDRLLDDTARCLEIERALARLDQIESLEPPFELVDAGSVLATWLRHAAPGEAPTGVRLARAA